MKEATDRPYLQSFRLLQMPLVAQKVSLFLNHTERSKLGSITKEFDNHVQMNI